MRKQMQPHEHRVAALMAGVVLVVISIFVDGPLEGLIWLAIAFLHWRFLRHHGSMWIVMGLVLWAIEEVMPAPLSYVLLIAGMAAIIWGFFQQFKGGDDDDGEAELVEEEQEKQLAERQRALNPAKDTV